eukprot:383610-Rhodomonas_salina.2
MQRPAHADADSVPHTAQPGTNHTVSQYLTSNKTRGGVPGVVSSVAVEAHATVVVLRQRGVVEPCPAPHNAPLGIRSEAVTRKTEAAWWRNGVRLY